MNKIKIIFILLASIISFTRCAQSGDWKINNFVKELNDECPENVPGFGTFTSVKYDAPRKNVIINLTVDHAENIPVTKTALLYDLQTATKENGNDLYQTIAEANASLTFVYSTSSSLAYGAKKEFTLTPVELRGISEGTITKAQLDRAFIEEIIDAENSLLPRQTSPGIEMTSAKVQNNYVEYTYNVSESTYNFNSLKRNPQIQKDQILQQLNTAAEYAQMRQQLELLVTLNMGYRYTYVANHSKDYFEVTITPDEIRQALK